MSAFSFRRLLPLALLAASSLTITSCVVRERPSYGYSRDRHDHHDDRYDRH